MIARLTRQVEERDTRIDSLKENLQKVNSALVMLFKEYNSRVEELDEQTGELSTAYYAYGTAKELKQNGVITKEGGFIGIGRTEKLMKDFKMAKRSSMDSLNHALEHLGAAFEGGLLFSR